MSIHHAAFVAQQGLSCLFSSTFRRSVMILLCGIFWFFQVSNSWGQGGGTIIEPDDVHRQYAIPSIQVNDTYLLIEIASPSLITYIAIKDEKGQVVASYKIQSNTAKIPINKLSSGTYMITIITSEGSYRLMI